MPTTLTETSSFDAATAPIGTDVRNAASMQTALQAQTNRSRFVFDRTTALADIAALKAIASPADGLVRIVRRFGFYVFDTSSAAAEALPFIVQPTTGTGRWIHELIDIEGNANGLATLNGSSQVPIAQLPAGVASGLATLDGSTKVTAAQVPNRLVASYILRLTANASATGASFVDMTGTDINVASCVAGDILVIDASLSAQTTANSGDVKLIVVDPTNLDTGQFFTATTAFANYHGIALHTVINAGSRTVRLQGRMNAAGTLNVAGAVASARQSTIRVLHYRP